MVCTYGTWLFAYTQLLSWKEGAKADSIRVVQLLEDAGAVPYCAATSTRMTEEN